MPTVVKMPKWGLTMTEGTVVDWIQNEGSEFAEGDPLLTVETEKAVDDVPAPADGILLKIVAQSGSEVPVSDIIAIIGAPGESISDDELAQLLASGPKEEKSEEKRDRRPSRDRRPASRDKKGRVNASPAAKKRAKVLGIDLANVVATGPRGRVTSDDVEAAASQTFEEPTEVDIDIEPNLHVHALRAGGGAGDPIVFLHGLGGSLSSWQLVLGDLANSRKVIAFDLPGHGASSSPDPASFDYSISGLASAIASALSESGIRRAIIVGHSLGGAVAIQLARQSPDSVSGLVLVDGAGLGSDINLELVQLMAGQPGADTARSLLSLFVEDQRLVTDRGVDEMARYQELECAWQSQRTLAGNVFEGDKQRHPFGSALAEIEIPVLLISGDRDRVIPATHSYDALVAFPDALLVIAAGAGHVPQIEQPDTVTRAIGRFARSIAE